MNTKIRTALVTLVASVSFATASVAPAISQAQPVKEVTPKGCAAYNPLTGEYTEVKDGTLMISFGGNVMQCKNGEWVKVAMTRGPVRTAPSPSRLLAQ